MSDYLKKDCVTKKLVKTRSQSLVGGSKNHSHSYSLFTSQYTRWKTDAALQLEGWVAGLYRGHAVDHETVLAGEKQTEVCRG